MKLPLFVAALCLVVVAGIGLYVTNFTAYLGSNPSTCNNCHVMDGVYEGWYHSGHKQWAVCGDCHTPHDLIPKYIVKSESGYRHVSAFMLGHIPDAIRPKDSSRAVIQENCIRCHEDTVDNMMIYAALYPSEEDHERYCYECHRSVAHGERGISLLPYQHQEK